MYFIDVVDRVFRDFTAMSRKQSATTRNDASFDMMTRKAINSHGHLGSLYDGCRDDLLVQYGKSIPGQQTKSSHTAKCNVIKGNLDVSRNILQIIGVEDELRLSLLLATSQRMGIVTILGDSNRINERTRLLYYSWIDREEQVSDQDLKNQKWRELLNHAPTATHVITGITFGIDLILLLHSPSASALNEIDPILHKISELLSNHADPLPPITLEEIGRLPTNIKITIHSNIPSLTAERNLAKLFGQIDLIKRNRDQCLPITYILRPLAPLHSERLNTKILCHLPSEIQSRFEHYFLDQRAVIMHLRSILLEDAKKFPDGYFQGRLYGADQQRRRIEKRYYDEKYRLSQLVIAFRCGQCKTSDVSNALIEAERSTFRNECNELIQILDDLKAKAHLIDYLQNRSFRYYNVIEDVNEEAVRNKLGMYDRSVRALRSNDTLNRDNPQKLNQILSDLENERQKNPYLYLMYVDDSYCTNRLHDIVLLPSNHRTNDRDTSSHRPHLPNPHSQPIVPLVKTTSRPALPIRKVDRPIEPPRNDEKINILLLGETGVGKSTFINALANYLTFDSLAQAKSNEPIVMIPVSFLITVGQHFEERIVKFGKLGTSNNENFNDVGQSVTQQCKSYIFTLQQNGRKLRIIDTPGFGDTRGLQQDDQNMQHVLQHISHLTHLNAICFLLKPNSSRLNMFFRTCLTQLFTFLAPAARKNVIFCFTNARSTFYTPGDTAPLLKAMLADSSMSDIPFQKENTFCFDSESFRYLVALRNNITFTEDDEREYQTSWSTSVRESKRLIDYLQKNLRTYYIQRR